MSGSRGTGPDRRDRTHLAAVAAPNGLGHVQRLLAVAEILAHRSALSRLTVLAAEWQRTAVDQIRSPLASMIRWNTSIFDPEMRRMAAPPGGCRNALVWADRMCADADLRDASVVISDNLAVTLAARPDAVLAGSFLWQDVWPDSEFAAWERSLLRSHNPAMLCNRWLVTDSVLSQTRPRMCSWTGRRPAGHSTAPQPRPIVEVNVGATGLLLSRAVELVACLVARGHAIQTTPTILAALPSSVRGKVRLRGGTPSLAVTRPGAQSLSEYVARGVPIAVMYEAANAEMAHNADRLVALGAAVDLAQAETDAAASRIEFILEPRRLVGLSRQLRHMPVRGLEEMADFLEDALRGQPAGEHVGQR